MRVGNCLDSFPLFCLNERQMGGTQGYSGGCKAHAACLRLLHSLRNILASRPKVASTAEPFPETSISIWNADVDLVPAHSIEPILGMADMWVPEDSTSLAR